MAVSPGRKTRGEKRLLLFAHVRKGLLGTEFVLNVNASTMATTTGTASPKPFMDLSKIPDWLVTHPELLKRGITLYKPLQPVSTSLYTHSAPAQHQLRHSCQSFRQSGSQRDRYTS